MEEQGHIHILFSVAILIVVFIIAALWDFSEKKPEETQPASVVERPAGDALGQIEARLQGNVRARNAYEEAERAETEVAETVQPAHLQEDEAGDLVTALRAKNRQCEADLVLVRERLNKLEERIILHEAQPENAGTRPASAGEGED